MLGVISAFRGESAALADRLRRRKQLSCSLGNGAVTALEGILPGGCRILSVEGGIGKLNAYLAARVMIEEWEVDRLIMIGICGGVDPEVSPGDVVVSTVLLQYDLGAWCSRRKLLQVPGLLDLEIAADRELTDRLARAARETSGDFSFHELETLAGRTSRVVQGMTGTSDILMDGDLLSCYREYLVDKGVVSVDMEGYAAAAAAGSAPKGCGREQAAGGSTHGSVPASIPFAQIRMVSDRSGEAPAVPFRSFMRGASRFLAEAVERCCSEP